MLDSLRLIALKTKKKSLEQQLEQLTISTKAATPDNINKIAKVGFELMNTNILIHSIETKNKQK